MAYVSPEMFWSCFLELYCSEFATLFEKAWESPTRLNSLMLSDDRDGGLLCRLRDRLPIPGDARYVRERYTIDAAYVSRAAYPDAEPSHHPAQIHVLVEHEVSGYSFDEIWKLSHWRAPLKVLITYDWSDPSIGVLGVSSRLAKHLEDLRKLLQGVNSHFPENSASRYLFIIGRQDPAVPPEWVALSLDPALEKYRRVR